MPTNNAYRYIAGMTRSYKNQLGTVALLKPADNQEGVCCELPYLGSNINSLRLTVIFPTCFLARPSHS
jgi:hypothetical protein